MENTTNTQLFDLANRLKELRDEKDTAEAMLKQINADIDAAEYALVTYMVDTETQNFTHAGTMFCLKNTVRASAAAGNKDELFTALRSAGYGDLVYETVNANSLSAFVREQMAENEDVLPDWVKPEARPVDEEARAKTNEQRSMQTAVQQTTITNQRFVRIEEGLVNVFEKTTIGVRSVTKH